MSIWIRFIPPKIFTCQMAQIKLKKDLEGLYKAKYAIIFSFIITVLLSNKIIRIYNGADYVSNFSTFFSNGSLIVMYSTLIGLLLAAYAIIITLIPYFSADSLQQPIFSQVNRLFMFTILDGIFLMVVYFSNGILPIDVIPDFIYIEVFLFISLLIGLFFCVLTLSDLFKIIRKRGTR
jgi:hypothetical protein